MRILISPAIILMIYGILTQTNIDHLFIAGLLPGLLGMLMYMAVIYLYALLKPGEAPRGGSVSTAESWRSLAAA